MKFLKIYTIIDYYYLFIMQMKNYIKNPIKVKDWDPTKGDFVSERVLEEDQLYSSRVKKKKLVIALLAIAHIGFLFLILMMYK